MMNREAVEYINEMTLSPLETHHLSDITLPDLQFAPRERI